MENKSEENLHWADEKEVVSSNKGMLLLLHMMKHLPNAFVFILIYPIAFFFFIFSKRGRNECLLFQKQLNDYTSGKAPKRVSAYKQILSFSLCVMEKAEGWLGNFHYNNLVTHDDDLKALQMQLEEGKGALLIGSHLGNIELMRSLSSRGEDGVSRQVSVTAVMELKSTEQFNRILQAIDPNVAFKVIDPGNIGPDTMIQMQEEIEKGGLVVITGDRTSARSRSRCIRQNFLGRPADFPYGVFLLASLLKAPTYYVFGLRTKTSTLRPRYNIFVEKSEIDFNGSRSERENKIKALCQEFVSKLEKFCIQFPYQWYNFYNFWLLQEGKNG